MSRKGGGQEAALQRSGGGATSGGLRVPTGLTTLRAFVLRSSCIFGERGHTRPHPR